MSGVIHLRPSDHANILLNPPCAVWSSTAAQAVLNCLGRCTAQNLVMCLWAMSHYQGSLRKEFFTPYLYHVSRVMGDLKSSELALLINSLARVRIRPGPIWMDR